MRSLLNFLLKYNNILIFLLLEVLALCLLASGASYHNIKLSNVVKSAEGNLQERLYNASRYLSLKEVNNALMRENLELRNRLERTYSDVDIYFFPVNDSIHRQQYIISNASIVNNSFNKQKNFITLNKGTIHGIKEGMAVVSPDGIAGVIVGVSRNFSVAMSVLNLDFRLSARFRRNGYFGSLTWDGRDESFASLNEIPTHLEINVGDTIETSGYSAVFPAGLQIGTVSSFDRKEGDFYNIIVKLSTDFHNMDWVYIIGNLMKEEQNDLEDSIESN
ncbi:MAG TPA: rod shape-determining protein MreC [Bacteroidales bacterium]|nr:rod shape-determining protein MreC [Bacteroidales bacterium]